MVEEATAAAHSLAKEADSLFQLVRQFNIGTVPASRNASGSTAPAPARARSSSTPATSPARQMTAKLVKAFGGNAAVAANEWTEF